MESKIPVENEIVSKPQSWKETYIGIGLILPSGEDFEDIFASKSIALEFCGWLSPAYKVHIIKALDSLNMNN